VLSSTLQANRRWTARCWKQVEVARRWLARRTMEEEMNRIVLVAALLGVTAALPLEAQGRGQGQNRSQTQGRAQTERPGQTTDRAGDDNRSQGRGPISVPPGQWPSEGKCRIWIDGVTPGLQPKETDCATARRNVPPNGRVLEGSRSSGGWDDRYGRDDDRYDRDDDRTTRRFINREGLECEEKAVTKNGKRSYDLKCREPKKGRDPRDTDRRDSWPPVRAQGDDRYCVDNNRDGRCDTGTATGYPTTLPDMIGAIVYGQGQRTNEVTRWLGSGRYQVRYTDANRDRRPEQVRWLDGAGALLQEWRDTNRDGRADIVNVYSAGRLVRSIGGR
jgi:hypothetical protein